ncbi:MAG: PPA1309 family protein [Nocardioides sp.]
MTESNARNDVPSEDQHGSDPLTGDPRWGDLDADPALAAAVLEIENHLADNGWDQPGRLYALVDTAVLVQQEPALAAAMGLDSAAEQGSLTAVEQDQMDPAQQLEAALESIEWPSGVAGCAAMVERLVLPPGADADLPEDPIEARTFASEHPERQTVRIVAGATRTGSTYCALRMRAHDDDTSVVGGIDLVPGLLRLLQETLDESHAPDHPHDNDRPARHEPPEENP